MSDGKVNERNSSVSYITFSQCTSWGLSITYDKPIWESNLILLALSLGISPYCVSATGRIHLGFPCSFNMIPLSESISMPAIHRPPRLYEFARQIKERNSYTVILLGNDSIKRHYWYLFYCKWIILISSMECFFMYSANNLRWQFSGVSSLQRKQEPSNCLMPYLRRISLFLSIEV